MTIKDDRQSILNNGPELTRQKIIDGLDELDQFKTVASVSSEELADLANTVARDEAYAAQTSSIDFVPNPALVEAQKRSKAEHNRLKVHGYKATRNREVDAYRKTEVGREERNKAQRNVYEEQAADQGNTVRPYLPATPERRIKQVALAVTKHREKRTPEKIAADKVKAAELEKARRKNMMPAAKAEEVRKAKARRQSRAAKKI